MNKIMIIGSPGSGKSTLAFELEALLNYPVFHFDRVYHIDNNNQIPRTELISKLIKFMDENDTFILDGNYTSTINVRLPYCDTIILFDLPYDVCVNNAIKRTKIGEVRKDMAPGFDITKMDDDFLQFITDFRRDKLPQIEQLLKSFKGRIIRITSYNDKEDFLKRVEMNG